MPHGWTLCYIDETDTAYHAIECKNLLKNMSLSNGRNFADYQSLLNAGGNFGCYHGISGTTEGAAFAIHSSNAVTQACQPNRQHTTKLNAWDTSRTTLVVCIKFPGKLLPELIRALHDF